MIIRTKYRLIYVFILLIFFIGLLIFNRLIKRRSPFQLITISDVNQLANSTWPRQRIPRRIHQTWRSKEIPFHWNTSFYSVITQNLNDFEHYLWTDDEVHTFVREKEPDFYEKTFLQYQYDIQRADAFRYVVLFHLGGIYIDMDIGCIRPFKDLVITMEALDPNISHLAAFPLSTGYGLEIEFMISTAGHPLFQQLISHLSFFHHYYLLHYYTILISTGPVYVSIQEYFFPSASYQCSVRAIDKPVFDGTFIRKVAGFTWIKTDAHIIFYLIHRSRIILTMFIIFITIIIMVIIFNRHYLSNLKKTRRI